MKYRIAGNVCGNYILRFVVKSKVCRFNVCSLHNTSLLMHLHQKKFADKMFAEFCQNRKPQNLIPRKHFRLYGSKLCYRYELVDVIFVLICNIMN